MVIQFGSSPDILFKLNKCSRNPNWWALHENGLAHDPENWNLGFSGWVFHDLPIGVKFYKSRLVTLILKITQAKSGEYAVNYGPFSYNKCQYSSDRYSGLEYSRLEFQIRF